MRLGWARKLRLRLDAELKLELKPDSKGPAVWRYADTRIVEPANDWRQAEPFSLQVVDMRPTTFKPRTTLEFLIYPLGFSSLCVFASSRPILRATCNRRPLAQKMHAKTDLEPRARL